MKNLLSIPVHLIQSAEPNRVQDHVEEIVLDWFGVPQEMPLRLLHVALHSRVLAVADPLEDLLQIRDLLLRHHHGEGAPVQNVLERQHEVVGDDHRHALVVDGLHDPGAVHLVAHGADAEPARLHVLDVGHPPGDGRREHLVDPHVAVLALPLLDQDRPDAAVHLAGEEGEDGTPRRRPPPDIPVKILGRPHVGLRQRNVLPAQEDPLGDVRIAHHFDRVLPEFLVELSGVGSLQQEQEPERSSEQ